MQDRTGARLAALRSFPLDAVPAELTGGVVAIGNFDGVHRGHATLVKRVREDAARQGVPSVALTFEPHPRSVIRPDAPLFRLTAPLAKARLLTALGIDGMIVIAFDRAFASHTAEEFVKTVLVERLRASEVVVGHDFHFGKGRGGSPAMLAETGRALGFSVRIVDPVADAEGAVISSTLIRDALAAGDVVEANRLLGYRWFVAGEVVHGDQRGRELGFPTANIRLGADCGLRHGIYAARLQRADGSLWDGVASFGRRPTFDNGAPLFETFLFDFDGDLYGEEVAVCLIGWIRPEERFDSVEALIAAMHRDVKAARHMLAREGRGTVLDQALGWDN